MIVWLVLGCSSSTPGVQAVARQVPAAEAIRVEVARVVATERPRSTLQLPGEVEGARDVLLAAPLGGQVEQVFVHRGEVVQRGAIIATVDTAIHGSQVDQAEAQHARAEAELRRVEQLGDLASEQQRFEVQTAERVARARLRAAQAQLRRATITAPFAGVAADVFPSPGEFLPPGSPVARVVQLDPVRVQLSVADWDVVQLEPGMPARVRAAAIPTALSGSVVFVGRAADLRTRAFPVEVEVPNPEERLLPGMIATVTIAIELPEGTITIPKDWGVARRDERGVFVATEDGHARWTPLELGAILRDRVTVQRGLPEGARVIITNHRRLVDGDSILVSREGICCAGGRVRFEGD